MEANFVRQLDQSVAPMPQVGARARIGAPPQRWWAGDVYRTAHIPTQYALHASLSGDDGLWLPPCPAGMLTSSKAQAPGVPNPLKRMRLQLQQSPSPPTSLLQGMGPLEQAWHSLYSVLAVVLG